MAYTRRICNAHWTTFNLIIWMVKRNESSFVAHHAKESLNFCRREAVYYFDSETTCQGLLNEGDSGNG